MDLWSTSGQPAAIRHDDELAEDLITHLRQEVDLIRPPVEDRKVRGRDERRLDLTSLARLGDPGDSVNRKSYCHPRDVAGNPPTLQLLRYFRCGSAADEEMALLLHPWVGWARPGS